MTSEPKKSARLAEKRKLREEAGTPVSEDDYYFTPLFSTTKHRSCSPSNSRGTPSPLLPQPNISPTLRRAKTKISPTTVLLTPNKSPLLVSPPEIPNLLSGSTDQVRNNVSCQPEIQSTTSGAFAALTLTTACPEISSYCAKQDKFAGLAMLGNADEAPVLVSSFVGVEGQHAQRSTTANSINTVNDAKQRSIYLSNNSGNYITFPKEIGLSISSNYRTETSKRCGVAGCLNPRKYVCSKTKVPLCSLECYKKNLEINLCHAEIETQEITV